MRDIAKLPAVPFAGLGRACFLISIDNGGINRGRSVEQWARDYTRWVKDRAEPTLAQIDAWLSMLRDEELDRVCCDTEDGDELLKAAPPFTDDLLNAYFDEVC